jgi:uncharacterized protein (TIGR03083 family)
LEAAVESSARDWIATLRGSHDRLAGLVGPATPDEVRAQSYCRDWTVAQVLSHLGSGAEIALMMLPAALGEGAAVSRDAFGPVWEVWNAKSPDEQATDGLAADEKYVDALAELTDAQLAAIKLDFFGVQFDAVGLVRLRLGEHALHTWDIAVARDPGATVPAEVVARLIDSVPGFLVSRVAKPLPEPFAVRITTTDPDRDYLLTSGESVTVTEWPGEAAAGGEVAQVRMPAEALVRLVYGRLDPAHTPASVSGDAGTLDKLRAIFPGF